MTIDANTNGHRLTVHEVQITTATIGIQTLRIGAKQITLSVFRQLIEERLIDWTTGEFRGVPWGTVNYHPDKLVCAHWGTHLHVVWQKGDELRHACVIPSHPILNDGTQRQQDAAPTLERYVIACLVAGQRPARWVEIESYRDEAESLRVGSMYGNPPKKRANGLFHGGKDHWNDWSAGGLRRVVAAMATDMAFTDALAAGGEYGDKDTRAANTLNDARAYLAATGGEASPDAIAAPIFQQIDQHARFAATINERYAELEALPQLFIAV